jgi:cholesterol transport system auxiliary component
MTMKTLCAAACVLLLGGCVSLLPDPPPPPDVYTLRVGAVEKTAVAQKPLVAIIGAPALPRMAAGSDIVWRQGPEMAVMDKVAWDDAAPDLLQTMLAETMDRRGVFRAAVRGGAGARGDLDVRWDVLAFEIVEENGIEAIFAANVRLIDARSRQIIETRRFETRAPLSSRSARLAVTALEKAAREACVQITDWAAERAPVPAPPPVVSGQPGVAPPQPSAASTRR